MIIQGDSRFIPLEDNSVNCIITSPPYWSLRKYDIPDLIWDGEEGCEHEWGREIVTGNLEFRAGHNTTVGVQKSPAAWGNSPSKFCLHCGAWKGQLGLEPTIDLYMNHLMQIMDECKRVLRDDGTMWVNIGDSYAGSMKGHMANGEAVGSDKQKTVRGSIGTPPTNNCGISSKSLCAIPERFVLSMMDRGWIRRNTIIWHKPNCMPASVTDRFTVDFEPVYFFVKSGKYWFERQYEAHMESSIKRNSYGQSEARCKEIAISREQKPGEKLNPNGRNRRCVWTIPTQPYPESHFATFPEALVEPMIKAGCPVGGTVLDPFCGSGTALRVAEKLQRKAIGIDLGYQELSDKRTKNNQIEMVI